MLTKILVPWDGTPESAIAMTSARTLAARSGATVTLLRVAAEGDPHGRDGNLRTAQASLELVAAELSSTGIPVETVARHGDPAQEIVAEASDAGVQLIAMSTHARSGLGRVLLGSVVEQVVAHSPVPVLLQRPGGHRLTSVRTILVPVDGTPGGGLALGAAVGLAQPFDARVVLVNVIVPSTPYVWPYRGITFYDPSWDEEARTAGQAYVDGLARRLTANGVRTEGSAVLGQVAPEIERIANDAQADLIVMSTHALTGPIRAILGSVADAIVRESHRPVLLVRRDALPPALARASS